MAPTSLWYLNTWSPVKGCLERLRTFGLAAGGVLLGAGFEAPKDSCAFELVLSVFCFGLRCVRERELSRHSRAQPSKKKNLRTPHLLCTFPSPKNLKVEEAAGSGTLWRRLEALHKHWQIGALTGRRSPESG